MLFDALGLEYDGYEMDTIASLLLIHSEILRRNAYTAVTDDVDATYAHSAKFKKIHCFRNG